MKEINVPAGWKLVPIEPSFEMKKAASDLADKNWCYCLTGNNVRELFSAMLSVAPVAPVSDSDNIIVPLSLIEPLMLLNTLPSARYYAGAHNDAVNKLQAILLEAKGVKNETD